MDGDPNVGDYYEKVFLKESIDCGLSEDGIKQCLEASQYYKDVNF